MLLAALVACGLFRWAIRPGMLAEVIAVEAEVLRLHGRLTAEAFGQPAADAGEAAELALEVTRSEARIAELGRILAASGDAEAVLESLGGMATAAEIRFLRFAPEPEYQLDGYLANAVSVVAEGTFFDFLRFFERVSRSSHLVLVEDVTLEKAADGLVQCRFAAVTVRPAGAGVEAPHPEPLLPGSSGAGGPGGAGSGTGSES